MVTSESKGGWQVRDSYVVHDVPDYGRNAHHAPVKKKQQHWQQINYV